MRKARDMMVRDVLVASPETSCGDIVEEFVTTGYTGMPVVDGAGHVVGVVTEFDLIAAYQQGRVPEDMVAEQVMSPPITVQADATFDDVADLLRREGILRVPVIDAGVLVGIVARHDLLRTELRPPVSEPLPSHPHRYTVLPAVQRSP